MTAIDRPWVGLANACYIDAVLADLAPEPICHQATLLLPWALVREAGK